MSRAELALRVVAVATFAAFMAGVTVAGDRNGSLLFDFNAYYDAARRLLAGEQIYDTSAAHTGGFGLFFYPPPFLAVIAPFTLLPARIAGYLWVGGLIATTLAAIALLPVRPNVRWGVLLLAGVSSPLLTAIVVGQVGPILLLLFVIAWRSIDRPVRFGLATGLGALVKLQPALLVLWAAATGRWRAGLVAALTFAVAAAVAFPVTGLGAWLDEAQLLVRVSQPVMTPHAYGVGRLAYEAGVSESGALVIHWLNAALVAATAIIAIWRCSPVASLLIVVTASQFLSPVLWDHYAAVLLLPTAWLLDRGRRWAAVIPLLTSSLVLPLNLSFLYPVSFWLALVAVAIEGARDNLPDQRRMPLVASPA